ncbi:UDP-N-acetylmuramate dehydrogenase [Candidatus Epulonipiscium viviparus]|uniref:UDP-N-acetylmuramate dehydrogenase n=1 Tax=Candidatus Epulonipiscium viviparus TaxID=420336 RepID=UPI0027380C7D|nr:UDP-N-acetylmuramate dehydrogenase [Candidatus Epulopiscium viviparus]
MKELIEQLTLFLKPKQIKIDEFLNKYTSFKIGGPARVLVKPAGMDEIARIINVCKSRNVKYYILGRGTNILANDKGYDGVIILLSENFSEVSISGNVITAAAGAKLSNVAQLARENALTGFEFAHGIPGTIGGAVAMNAGAYDGEMKDVVVTAVVLMPNGEQKTLSNEELELGYRTSVIVKEGLVVLSAAIELKKASKDEISNKMKDFGQRRRDKQPLNYPSAGSTFKRPTGYFAGKLIEDANLSGFRIGDAMVSDKHCGFVINVGNATFEDVTKLIEEVKKRVFEKFGVMLEEEVKIL